MSAAEYMAGMADRAPIKEVEKEFELVKESPSVKESVTKFWCEFWREISRRYA